MQKLTSHIPHSTVTNVGSALVGAIVLALIMSIVAGGFILISANSANNEAFALENEKAFQSGE